MRGLVALVIGMGVLILVGASVLVVVIASRLSDERVASSVPILLQEPAGTKLVSASADGKLLTLVLTTPGGQTIEVRDLDSGEVVRRFSIAP